MSVCGGKRCLFVCLFSSVGAIISFTKRKGQAWCGVVWYLKEKKKKRKEGRNNLCVSLVMKFNRIISSHLCLSVTLLLQVVVNWEQWRNVSKWWVLCERLYVAKNKLINSTNDKQTVSVYSYYYSPFLYIFKGKTSLFFFYIFDSLLLSPLLFFFSYSRGCHCRWFLSSSPLQSINADKSMRYMERDIKRKDIKLIFAVCLRTNWWLECKE